MAIRFELPPGERVNEIELSRRLDVSRTPLREALNRLTADGFLTFQPGKGFFRRRLEIKEVFDLYEMRLKLEVAAAELAVERCTPDALETLRDYLRMSMREDPSRSVNDLVALDEGFHERLAELSGNHELVETLKRINARIRFVRWVNMEQGRRQHTQHEHLEILEAIAAGDALKAKALLHGHIDGRLEQITLAIREGYALIYMRRMESPPL